MTDFPLLTSECGVSSAYYFDGQVFAHTFLTACSSGEKIQTYVRDVFRTMVNIYGGEFSQKQFKSKRS